MSLERLERIGSAVERHVGEEKLAGVVTLAYRRGEVVHSMAVGLRDREAGAPMTPDTIFRIYSMTKPITCVALMTLFERGLVRLTDPVSRYIPEMGKLRVWAGGKGKKLELAEPTRPVTVRDLMTHTAGFTYPFAEYGPVEELYHERVFLNEGSLSSFVSVLSGLPLAFQPGSAFRYSVAHDVVGHLIQIVSGQSLEAYLRQQIFEPLGMVDTGYHVPKESLDRFAAMYGSLDITGRNARSSEVNEQAEAGVNRLLEGPRDSLQSHPHQTYRGGHGLVSTAPDYLRFCRMLLGGGALEGARILGRKTLQLMVVNHLGAGLLPYQVGGNSVPGYGYGLGMRVMMDLGQAQVAGSVGEFGWGGAATTNFWVDPAEDLVGIEMAQFQPSQYHPVAADFRTAVYQAIVD
jgi:CubicO group peptidase (beta-lactamase class C family)